MESRHASKSGALWCGLALLWCVGAGCKKPEKITMSLMTPTFDGPEMATSSSYLYASSLRNSRVLARRRPLTSFQAYECTGRTSAYARTPVLVVSPDGKHGLLGLPGRSHVLDEGKCIAEVIQTQDLVALDSTYVVGADVSNWDGHILDEHEAAGRMPAYARRVDAERYFAITAHSGEPVNEEIYLILECARRHPKWLGEGLLWSTSLPGWDAIAAIGADWSSVIAFRDGTLYVYAPEADAQKNPLLVVKKELGFRPLEVSLIPPYIVLTEALTAMTRVHVLDGRGAPVFVADTFVAAGQPAIDGGSGRMYIVGDGIAALDGPTVAWARASPYAIRGTAFEDGSLALAAGRRLQIVARSGEILQSFEATEDLITPPAITADGSVWVASEQAVYVAR